MTQEHSPDNPPAGPDGDFSPPAALPRPNAPAAATPVYGPATTVTPKRRAAKRSRLPFGEPAATGGIRAGDWDDRRPSEPGGGDATQWEAGRGQGGAAHDEPGHDTAGHDGTVPAGTVHAGTVHAGTVHAGTVHDGTVHAGTVHDGAPDGGAAVARRVARPATRRRTRRGPFAWIVDSRGLTFLGALLLAGVLGTVGGLISAGTRGWVGTEFSVCFVAGCVLAALLVHREDLLTTAFLPPLLFVAIATAVGLSQAKIAGVPVKRKVIFQVGYAMSFGARTMWLATAATAIVAAIMFVIRHPAPAPQPVGRTIDSDRSRAPAI